MTDSPAPQTDHEETADPVVEERMRPSLAGQLIGPMLTILVALVAIVMVLTYGLPNIPADRPTTQTEMAAEEDAKKSEANEQENTRPTRRQGSPQRPTSPEPTSPGESIPEDLRFGPLPNTSAARMAFLRAEAARVTSRLVVDLPDRVAPVSLKALIHDRFGESDLAIESWHKALEIDPNFVDAYSGLGKIMMDRGEYEQAESHFRKAIAIRSKTPGVRESLARSLMNQSRIEEAVDCLSEDVRLFPKAVSSHFFLGQASLQLGQLERAVKNFKAAIQLDPKCTYAYYGLANSYRKLGKRAEASRTLEAFRKLKKVDLETEKERTRKFDDESKVSESTAFAHGAAANIYAENREFSKAIVHWVRATELNPNDVRSRIQLVKFFEQSNNIQQALRLLKELRDIEPQNPAYATNLGAALLRLRKFDAAEDAFREAIKLAPKRADGHANFANFLMQTGRDANAALESAKKAVELDPSGQNCALLGASQANMGNFSEALSSFDKARRSEPQNRQYEAMYRRVLATIENQKSQANRK